MEWIGQTLSWYGVLLLIGVVFTPVARFLFPQSPDRGYPFAKTIGIIALTYAMFLFGVLHLAQFTALTLFFMLALAAIGNYFVFKKSHLRGVMGQTPLNKKLIVIEEVLFVAALFALTYMRGQEPSIHGLEKFMDYGFMMSILRSQYFPPADMWYTPLSINYYYLGHMSGSILIKLSGIAPSVGYNLILATIFAQGITLAFSLSVMITVRSNLLIFKKTLSTFKLIVFGLLGAVLVNTIGNLHTIYLFTKGYPNDNPVPFWGIMGWYNPEKYWYPNATRFIPFTIHEFPSYSYVVADLHGHVFDIPFVLLTLALVYNFFMNVRESLAPAPDHRPATQKKHKKTHTKHSPVQSHKPHNRFISWVLNSKYMLLYSVGFGFMLAVHYMTNAFDGPIYFLLLLAVFFALYRISVKFFAALAVSGISFIIFSLPFSIFFKPFATGIGVNCAPSFLVTMQKLGPFLFEKGNCQVSPPWMLLVLWGFYLISLILFIFVIFKSDNQQTRRTDVVPFIFFILGFFLITIPEFFYIKDIYPQHFRANTMFKMGYQAFMMMGIAAMYVFYRISILSGKYKYILKVIFLLFFTLTFIYPFYSVPSYYGRMDKPPLLDGQKWMYDTLPQDYDIMTYLNNNAKGQPVILEAQGDSYTDYERISAFTGLPTVAGWWVHEWLWRGSADIVGNRIPEITDLYESTDLERTKALISKYKIKYVVVSGLEREKYKNLNQKKFEQIGKKIYTSTNGLGALYQVN